MFLDPYNLGLVSFGARFATLRDIVETDRALQGSMGVLDDLDATYVPLAIDRRPAPHYLITEPHQAGATQLQLQLSRMGKGEMRFDDSPLNLLEIVETIAVALGGQRAIVIENNANDPLVSGEPCAADAGFRECHWECDQVLPQ
ncbi:MAG: hypothetical protein M3Y18_07265, partial [Candidatus Eremiobacteraeota bacterium]|nr:hypothetical protein [Candidatus Eremiobacteraeota bacterium]